MSEELAPEDAITVCWRCGNLVIMDEALDPLPTCNDCRQGEIDRAQERGPNP